MEILTDDQIKALITEPKPLLKELVGLVPVMRNIKYDLWIPS